MEGRKPKVLIVEDEPRNIRLLEAMVAPMDVDTHVASNSSKALEMAQTLSPDVILIDIMMPGLDGIEIYHRLKEDHATRNIPVVYLTGGVDFISKPLQDVIVEANVKSAVRIKQLLDEIEELTRERTNLIHMIIHDMKNLLAVSLGYTRLLLADETVPSGVRKALYAIERTNNEILGMTSNLLELDRLESGTCPIAREEVEVYQLANERIQLLSSQITARGIQFSHDAQSPERDFVVSADRSLLSRVLDNLLMNAVKFSPDNGCVKFEVFKKRDMCAIAVTNDGPPIPPEYRERIFEKFVQVEAHQATGRKGLGLGLAFCKMALKAMDGAIMLESPVPEREDGVRFVFYLPLVWAQPKNRDE